jgi:hypothetical protein
MVRMWQYGDRWFCSFLPWKTVRFVPEDAGPPSAAPQAESLAANGPPSADGPPAAAAQTG